MKKIIAANWKNNGSKKFIKDYFNYFLENLVSNNEIKDNKHEIKMDFDFPEWLTETTLPFKKFNNKMYK